MPKGIPKNGINRGWFTNSPRPYKKTGILKVCKCGKEFYCEKNVIERKKYCSTVCFYNYKSYGYTHSEETNKKISLSNKGKKLSEEIRKKISLARIGKSSPKKGKEYPHLQGENSSRWIEDRSRIKKSDKKHLDCGYISWMLKVKRRDNWKCKIENLDCKGRLEAHHILPWRDYPELRYEANNGITLCHFHHPRKRTEEERLSPYFREIISQN